MCKVARTLTASRTAVVVDRIKSQWPDTDHSRCDSCPGYRCCPLLLLRADDEVDTSSNTLADESKWLKSELLKGRV